MAHILQDSFDFYGAKAEAAGLWTSLGAMSLSSTTRFGVGQSVVSSVTSGDIQWSASFANSTTTLFLTFAHTQVSAIAADLNSQALRIYDGATVQMTVVFNRNGDIRFYRGNTVTLLGTYAGAFNGSGDWKHFQIKIVFSGTVGEFHVRRNGATADDYSLTGVNNISTANAYANKIDMIATATGAAQTFDDFWMYDSAVVTLSLIHI